MFEPLGRTKTVPEQIAVRLRHAILGGELEEGEVLPSEKAMASQFETNRVSLRQALQLLKADGLIEGGQGKSWRVRDFRRHGGLHLLPVLFEAQGFSPEMVRVFLDFLSVRTPVLREVLGVAMERMERQQQAHLRGCLEALSQAVASGASAKEQLLADLAWFEALLDASNSLLYRSIYRPLSQAYRSVLSSVAMLWQPPEDYPQPLWEIQGYLEGGDKAGAQRALEVYLEEDAARLRSFFASLGEEAQGEMEGLRDGHGGYQG